MNYIKSLAEKGLLLLLIFFFVYPIRFVFMPIGVRLTFCLLGFVLLLFHRKIQLSDIKPLLPAFFVLLFSIVAIAVNRTTDIEYIRFCLSQLIIWFAAYFILSFGAAKRADIYTIIRIVVYAILIQSFLSTAISTNLDIKDRLLGLIVVEDEEVLEDFIGSRFVGWGTSFFSAGVTSGLGLICISFLLVHNKAWSPLITAVIYGIILGVGIMLARTTIVGCGVSLVYFFLEYRRVVSWKSILRFFFWLLGAIVALVSIAYTVLDERILNWAFELFLNYVDSGSVETTSTDALADMYIFPSRLSTYIFGDGLFSGLYGGYYMGTDVGFLRLLFYFGIFGLFAIFYWHFHIVTLIKNESRELYIFAIVILLYCIFLNLKGITDMLFILILIYLHSLNNAKISNTD